MNTILAQSIREADGRYLSDSELDTLDTYVGSYSDRLKTYGLLHDRSEEFILMALKTLAQTDAQTIREHKDKCVRDMGYVLRGIAIAILRDDPRAFREEVLLWMQNIMAALHKEKQSSRAYRLLQEVVVAELPAESAALINGYLEEFITALNVGMA
jgi:hypothetical protein